MSQDRETNLALFIDFDNVALGARDARQRFDIKLVLERLLEKGKVIVKKAYADWHYYKEHMSSLHEAAIELIEIPMPRISGKNSADIRLVVDAMDLCYSKEHLDTFVIVSGDSDFSPLVSKLRENNKRVIGIGMKNSSSKLLIGNCDEFIFYDDIYRMNQSRIEGSARQNVPKDKRELFDFLVQTVQSLLLESRGVLYSSLIKDTMTRKQPAFSERSHGYSNFGDLLDEARKLGLLIVERDAAAGGTWVVHGIGAGVESEAKASEGEKSGAKASAKASDTEKSGASRSSRRRRRSGRGGDKTGKAEPRAAEKQGDAAAKAEAGADGGKTGTDAQSPATRAADSAPRAEADGKTAKKTAKKTAGKKTAKKTVKKTASKKTEAKKTATKKAPAKKTVTKKTAAKKTATKKTATKKAPTKKTAAKKTAKKTGATGKTAKRAEKKTN